MKKIFLKGFILGALVFGSIQVIATTSFNAIQASFPILINGETWTTDKPVVVIEGSTYLPLRAIGEVLGVKVNWNEGKRRVEIGDTPNVSVKNPKVEITPNGGIISRSDKSPLVTVEDENGVVAISYVWDDLPLGKPLLEFYGDAINQYADIYADYYNLSHTEHILPLGEHTLTAYGKNRLGGTTIVTAKFTVIE